MFNWFKPKRPQPPDLPEPPQALAEAKATIEAPGPPRGETKNPPENPMPERGSPTPLSDTEKLKLEIQLRHELEERLRPEVEATIKASRQRELNEARQRTLLSYLVAESGQDAGTFYAKLPESYRQELDSAMRRHLKPIIEQTLRRELRDQIRSEETDKLRQEIRREVLSDPELLSRAQQLLGESVKEQVKARLLEQLKPQVREQLIREMSQPVLVNESGQNEASVAAAIQRHLNRCKSQIRQQELQAMWQRVSTAIVEAFGAAGALDDDSLDDAMQAAHDAYEVAINAAEEAYDDSAVGVDPHERVRLAVEAALTSLGFGSHLWGEHWKWFCARAKALIARQTFSDSPSSETPPPPDGFYRAIQSYTCDRTGRGIEPGECYLVFGGLRIALPLTADAARQLILENPNPAVPSLNPRPEAWPAPNDKISPSKVYRRNP